MEKLINLLNEYEKERKSGYIWKNIDSYDNCVYGVDCDGETEITMYSDLYSKYYGFIKWLFKEDKIDTFQLAVYIEYHSDYIFVANRELRDKNVDEDHLLMLLSIQDEPIEFLISILK